MRNDWILDVLADLRAFAQSSDLPLLAEQLDDTALVALAEIAAQEERTRGHAHGNGEKTGGPPEALGAG